MGSWLFGCPVGLGLGLLGGSMVRIGAMDYDFTWILYVGVLLG